MRPSNRPLQGKEAELPEIIVVDACVLLNLHATGCIREILGALPSKSIVSSYVRREVLWHYTVASHPTGGLERQDVALAPLVAEGLIEVVELSVDEQRSFVDLAQQLGDGEAASGALAIARLASVATDDGKARRVFSQGVPPIGVIGTATLLRCWEEVAGIARDQIAAALRAICVGAKFQPSSNDDGASWWHQRIAEGFGRGSKRYDDLVR